MAGYGDFDHAISVLEQAVSGPAWICGEQFTAADVYVGSQVDWGLTFKSIPASPTLEAYAARLRERPAYQRQKGLDTALMEEAQKAG
jgi:glutathione S-transferase